MNYEVSRFGSFLATRESAAKIREDLERHVRKVKDGETVVISFADVEAVTISFIDELVGRLVAARISGDLPEVGLIFERVNREIQEALTVCLERREAVGLVRVGRRLELVGGDSYLEETFALASKLKAFRAGDVAEGLRISPQNANNRLKRLAQAGVLLRSRSAPDSGGKEFIYNIPR